MDAGVFFVSAIIGLFVQYLIIRAAVTAGLRVWAQKDLAQLLGQMTGELTKGRQ